MRRGGERLLGEGEIEGFIVRMVVTVCPLQKNKERDQRKRVTHAKAKEAERKILLDAIKVHFGGSVVWSFQCCICGSVEVLILLTASPWTVRETVSDHLPPRRC